MRKVKVPKITYQYVYGDNPTPEQVKETQEVLDRVYDRIFTMAMESLRKKKNVKANLKVDDK